MTQPYYIGCDNEPAYSDRQRTHLQCWVSQNGDNATVYTLEEMQAQLAPQLSAEDGAIFATVIFTTSMLAWGFRLAIKQLNLGV